MSKGSDLGRLRAAVLAAAVLAAPFIALLFRPEAGLVVMRLRLARIVLARRRAGCYSRAVPSLASNRHLRQSGAGRSLRRGRYLAVAALRRRRGLASTRAR